MTMSFHAYCRPRSAKHSPAIEAYWSTNGWISIGWGGKLRVGSGPPISKSCVTAPTSFFAEMLKIALPRLPGDSDVLLLRRHFASRKLPMQPLREIEFTQHRDHTITLTDRRQVGIFKGMGEGDYVLLLRARPPESRIRLSISEWQRILDAARLCRDRQRCRMREKYGAHSMNQGEC